MNDDYFAPLNKLAALLLCCFLGINTLGAQPQVGVHPQQQDVLQPQLDATHLLLDGSLSDAEVADRPFVFNDFRQAVAHFSDTTTLYIRPWVYWVDDPLVPEVVVGKNGREPFGMVIHAKKLHFIGLGSAPHDVVLASQRGQTQGAVGNFTMFDFHVDELTVENLTMGNYCNVDLDYPLRPSLGRKKRSDAITQAHVGYVHGRRLTARNVRFISRLNLNPLNGASQSLYEHCHFECTDDALNGNAVYRHCDFDLYGAKPFWSTYGSGPLFDDCDFYVRSHNREVFFCKQGGPVTIVNCRYHAPSDVYIGWTPYPQPWLRCYQSGFTLNGKPYTIGSRQPQNTILLDSIDRVMHLPISRHSAELQAPASLVLQSEPGAQWRVQQGYSHFANIVPDSSFCLPNNSQKFNQVTVNLTNDTDEMADFCIISSTSDGREAACHVTLKPSLLPAPRFLKKPKIKIEKGVARLDYQLDLEGRTDRSLITWRRDDIPVSVSNDHPQRTYQLTTADVGHRLSASIVPMHNRCLPSEPMESAVLIKSVKFVNTQPLLDTDFHDFPCGWQPLVSEGNWTVDGFKPADTADYSWSFDREKPMWEYGEGFNGAVGKGLLQAQRGARLMYTPLAGTYHNMSLELQVDPTKTAGQGFGSATGQYMDVCLKFDTRTLTGYGLRIVRTTKHAKAVDFFLVEYQNGQVRPLTEPVSATCYRTGCTILLDFIDGKLSADVTTRTPQPASSVLPHEVHLKAVVADNPFGGIHIQHTGTCGESTTMLHHLKTCWSH